MSSKSRDKHIPTLVKVFRNSGYDGASVAQISKATGLGKASLYHHFPGEKEEMMSCVLEFLSDRLKNTAIKALQSEGTVGDRFAKMSEALMSIYDGGKEPCILAIVLLGNAQDTFQQQIQDSFQLWLDAMSKALQESGIDPTQAQMKSEEIAIGVQGSLIVAQALNDPTVFYRFIQSLPQKVQKGQCSKGKGQR